MKSIQACETGCRSVLLQVLKNVWKQIKAYWAIAFGLTKNMLQYAHIAESIC